MPSTEADREAANPSPAAARWLHIAVGVVVDEAGRILISERKPDCAYAGQWEFPGGKIEPGEDVEQALGRELHEELGLRIEQARPLIRIRHEYPDRRVLLDTWQVTAWSGTAIAREGQRFAWVEPSELNKYPMLAANGPIVRAAQLPDRYLITPAAGDDRKVFLDALQRSLESGVCLVRLRQPGMAIETYHRLAAEVADICRSKGAGLLVDDAGLADELFTGLHLTSNALGMYARGGKRPVPQAQWLAASCHTVQELQHAEQLGCDFAVLGAVNPTDSHPNARTLGWQQFEAFVANAGLPVYALGGLGPDDLPQAWSAGGQGIAAIRGLWAVN